MSKKNKLKNNKFEKETRRLLESTSELLRIKDTGEIKFKGGKKDKKKARRSCLHAYIKKGELRPLITNSPTQPGEKMCRFCGATFPLVPLTEAEYANIYKSYMSELNQMALWLVSFGGDKECLKLLVNMRTMVPRLEKMRQNMVKEIMKHKEREEKASVNKLEEFSGDFNYNY